MLSHDDLPSRAVPAIASTHTGAGAGRERVQRGGVERERLVGVDRDEGQHLVRGDIDVFLVEVKGITLFSPSSAGAIPFVGGTERTTGLGGRQLGGRARATSAADVKVFKMANAMTISNFETPRRPPIPFLGGARRSSARPRFASFAMKRVQSDVRRCERPRRAARQGFARSCDRDGRSAAARALARHRLPAPNSASPLTRRTTAPALQLRRGRPGRRLQPTAPAHVRRPARRGRARRRRVRRRQPRRARHNIHPQPTTQPRPPVWAGGRWRALPLALRPQGGAPGKRRARALAQRRRDHHVRAARQPPPRRAPTAPNFSTTPAPWRPRRWRSIADRSPSSWPRPAPARPRCLAGSRSARRARPPTAAAKSAAWRPAPGSTACRESTAARAGATLASPARRAT